MKLLVIGGTVFLGRHFVEQALVAGHEVTLFNRGKRNPDLFPTVEKLRGDRREDLSSLKGRRWDAVIDPSGYIPREVRKMATLLADATNHYTFISSISVYSNTTVRGQNESGPVGTLEDESVEEISGVTYGPLKALCEQAAERAMPGRVLTIRPGLIVGPYDPSDRFTYWPKRVAAGGEVLAPDHPDRHSQVIDVRDLAAWILKMVEAKATGVFNATGPTQPLIMGEVLETCKQVTNSDASFTWIPEPWLLEQKVGPWIEVPLWLPMASDGISHTDCSKAFAQGLTFRPLGETVRDTLAWEQTRPADHAWRAGLKPEREKEVLQAWHAKR